MLENHFGQPLWWRWHLIDCLIDWQRIWKQLSRWMDSYRLIKTGIKCSGASAWFPVVNLSSHMLSSYANVLKSAVQLGPRDLLLNKARLSWRTTSNNYSTLSTATCCVYWHSYGTCCIYWHSYGYPVSTMYFVQWLTTRHMAYVTDVATYNLAICPPCYRMYAHEMFITHSKVVAVYV